MNIHNKLVRDHIIDIIRQNNKIPVYSILEEDTYKQALKNKLIEESNEVLHTSNNQELIKELSDIFEVFEHIIEVYHLDLNDILLYKEEKAIKNGKFKERIFLEYVKEDV